MKTTAIVITEDPVYVNWLSNAAPGVEFSALRPVDAEDLLERIQLMGRVEMIFFEVDELTLPTRLPMIEKLMDRMPDVPLAAVGGEHHAETVLACMRAGARDFFVLRKDEANVAASLGRLLRRSAQAQATARIAPSAKQGKLFTVLGAHPHEGLAFTAAHLALACAEEAKTGERVLLLDAATPAGAAAIFLNLTASYSVLDAINDVHRCDQTLVDTAFPKHNGGIHVLSLPEDQIGRANFAEADLLKLVQVLRGLFAVIVVALDAHQPQSLVRGVVADADRSLLLSDQSILKSRHAKYLLRALRLDETPLDRMGLVVDNYRKRVGLEPRNLAELLDLPLAGTLSCDAAARIQATNSGEPLFTVAPKDEYCGAMRRLARSLLSGSATMAADAPKGLLGKLFA